MERRFLPRLKHVGFRVSIFMKKIILVLSIIVGCIACQSSQKNVACDTYGREEENIISTVENGRGYKILKDNETGCEYVIVYSQGPNGGVCTTLLVDAEGKPKIRK